DLGALGVGPEERRADGPRDEEAHAKPEQPAEHARHGGIAEPRLCGDNQKGDAQTERHAGSEPVERPHDRGRIHDHANENGSGKDEAGHKPIVLSAPRVPYMRASRASAAVRTPTRVMPPGTSSMPAFASGTMQRRKPS